MRFRKISIFLISFLFIFILSGCGFIEVTSTCEHDYSVYAYDENEHWIKCSKCDQYQLGSTRKHEYGNPSVIKTPTQKEDGLWEYKCKYCDYSYEETYTYEESMVETYKKMAKDLVKEIDELAPAPYGYILVDELMGKYEAIPENYRELVTNIQVLLDLKTQRDEDEAIKLLNAKIEQCDLKDYETMQAIIDEYNSLSDTLKESVVNYKKIEGMFAQHSMNVIATNLVQKIDEVDLENTIEINIILEIYNNFNDEAKAYVTNIDKITDSIGEAAKLVEEKIKLIRNVEDSYEAIVDAKESYDLLTSSQQKLVSNRDVLVNAYNAYYNYQNLDLAFSDVETIQQAIINTAFAYYFQGSQIQYDQYSSRRNVTMSPEFANDYIRSYLDCSSFVDSVFYYLYGANIINKSVGGDVSTANISSYARSNVGYSDVIYYKNNVPTKNDSSAAEVRALLQPGDVYTYRHDGSGHTMLYLGTLADGNDYFMHCTGTCNTHTASNVNTYGPKNYTGDLYNGITMRNGSVVLDKADIVFKKSCEYDSVAYVSGARSRYIWASGNDEWSIIRPTTTYARKGYDISNNALLRLANPYITTEKSVDIGNSHSTVNQGELTYTLSVENCASKLQGVIEDSSASVPYIYVSETIPENTEFVSCDNDGIYKDGVISWQIPSLESGTKIKLTYTLKANGLTGDSIVDDKCYVNGIQSNIIRNQIRSNINFDDVVTELKNKISQVQTSNYLITVGIQAYTDAYGVDIKQGGVLCADPTAVTKQLSNTSLINGVFNTSTIKRISTSSFEQLVVDNLWGGLTYREKNKDDNLNMKIMLPEYLEPGDIIVAKFGSTFGEYIYCNKNLLLGYNNKILVEYANSAQDVKEAIYTLCFYNYFVVIRPSLCSLFDSIN